MQSQGTRTIVGCTSLRNCFGPRPQTKIKSGPGNSFNFSHCVFKLEWPYTGIRNMYAEKLEILIRGTNLLPRTLKSIFSIEDKKLTLNKVEITKAMHGGVRIAFVVSIDIEGIGTKQFVLKIPNCMQIHMQPHNHQIFGLIVANTINSADPITAGIWRLDDGYNTLVLTEKLIPGPTLQEMLHETKKGSEQEKELFRTAFETAFRFWQENDEIFIKDPHREQFVFKNTNPPQKARIIDTGLIETDFEKGFNFVVPNNGRVLFFKKGQQSFSLQEIFIKTKPRKLLAEMIASLEWSEDNGVPGDEFWDISNKHTTAYHIPRTAIIEAAITVFGTAEAAKFFAEARGADKELDELVAQTF